MQRKQKSRIEREKKQRIEIEKKEKILRDNAIPSPIDLGLSVKWANFNIGAYKPNDFGSTFYWAENAPSKSGCPKHEKKNTNQIGNISGKKEYDAATNIYGGKWRLPSDEECKELIEKCIWKLDIIEGVEGYCVIGPNGNSIFLPFTYKYYGDSQYTHGYYWSSCPSYRRGLYESAQNLMFERDSKRIELNIGSTAARCLYSIRPVYGDLPSEEESKSMILAAFSNIQDTKVDALAEIYEKFEEQSCIKDEEKTAFFFDSTKTYTDECGVVYSIDGKRLLDAGNCNVNNYTIKEGTEIICSNAFRKKFFQECNNKVELGIIVIPASVCYIAPSALPDTCKAESHSPYYDIIDELLIDKRKLSVIRCLNKFKQKAFIGAPITSIESYAFAHCGSLRKVSLPDSLMTIKECAFYNCPMLEEIILPNSVEEIEESAFGNCESLNIMSLPTNIRNIGNHAFFRCKHFEGIIPAQLESLGISPFPKNGNDINSLSPFYSVYKGLLIDNTKNSVVQSLQSLKVLNLPESIVSIDDYAFSWSDLESVIIPSTIKSIGDNAFNSCKHLTHIEFNKSIKHISKGMFSFCDNLEEVHLPDWIEEIGDYAFRYCKKLKHVVLPKGLVVIGVQAFAECHNLESIIIPENVERIGILPQYMRIHEAFYGCKNLKKVVLNAKHLDFFELPDSVQAREIGENAETIPSYFYSGCDATSIEIPKNIKEIKAESFQNCKSLSELSFYCEDVELQNNWIVNCKKLRIINIVKEGFDKIKVKLPVIDGVKYKIIYKHDWGIIKW